MPSFVRLIQILSVVPLLSLAGCGDGWEMRPYDKTPYGDRTAGHGVEYVLAKMAPSAGPVTDKAVMEDKKEEPKAEPVRQGDEVFNKAQKK